MRDQAGLFDLLAPVLPRPPTRAAAGGLGKPSRTVVADVSVHDASALCAEVSRDLNHSVVIGEAADAEDDDDDLLDHLDTPEHDQRGQ
jgi:hypothetical protein